MKLKIREIYCTFCNIMQKRKRSAAPTSTRKKRKFDNSVSKSEVRRVVNSAIGAELKYYDTNSTGINIVTSATCAGGEVDESATLCATTIAQGDGEQNRDGRKCMVQSVHYKGIINVGEVANESSPDVYPTIFIAMVLDKQTNGGQLSSEDVFTNPGAIASLCATPLLNLTNRSRFQVLKTWKMDTMPVSSIVHDGTNYDRYGRQIRWELYHRFKNPLKCTYSGTTSTIANQVDNSVHLIAFTSSDTFSPQIRYNCRTRFTG